MNLSTLPKNISFLFLLCIFLGTSCRSKKDLTNTTKKKIPTSVQEFIEGSEVFENSFTGFALYDPKKEKMLYQHDADKYFTPASNTKIFTLYTALEILADSIPALKYIVKNDSLIFWGTADPSFLNIQTPENQSVVNFLKNRKENKDFLKTEGGDKSDMRDYGPFSKGTGPVNAPSKFTRSKTVLGKSGIDRMDDGNMYQGAKNGGRMGLKSGGKSKPKSIGKALRGGGKVMR